MSSEDQSPTPSGRRDPGWRPLLRYLPLLPIPHPYVLSRWAKRRGDPPIIVFRAYLAGSTVFYFVALTLLSWLDLDAQRVSPRTGQGVWAATLFALSSGAVAAAVWWSRRPMACGGTEELRLAVARRFWLASALVSGGVLLGFVASFALFALWPYLVGMVFGLVGVALIAPTTGRVQRQARELASAGCPGALQQVLF